MRWKPIACGYESAASFAVSQELVSEMAPDDGVKSCRVALEPVVKELKFLLRANRIDPLVAQTVIDYVNETRKVVKAQCLFRGVIARRRTRKIKQDALMRGEKPPESAVQKAIHIFSPAGEMKDRESAAKP